MKSLVNTKNCVDCGFELLVLIKALRLSFSEGSLLILICIFTGRKNVSEN